MFFVVEKIAQPEFEKISLAKVGFQCIAERQVFRQLIPQPDPLKEGAVALFKRI